MSYKFYPGVGMVHLQTVQPRRHAPAGTLHRWDKKDPAWGESTTCVKCGCVKHRLKSYPDWCERYQPAGTTDLLAERPPCTGKPVA